MNGPSNRPPKRRTEGKHSYNLPTTQLSPRELEVCKLLVEGKSVQETALQLGMCYQTANIHLWHSYQKLGIHNRSALVRHFALPNVNAVRETMTNSMPPTQAAIDLKPRSTSSPRIY